MEKILVILGVIVVALLGAYYVFTKPITKTQAMTPPPTQNQILDETASPSPKTTQVEVTLGTVGFAPQTVTIKAGTKVVWVNQSGSVATVNSDPHPIHNAYPALNLGQFQDGQSLSLVFPTPGTYGYHNHLNPSQRGTVVVTN